MNFSQRQSMDQQPVMERHGHRHGTHHRTDNLDSTDINREGLFRPQASPMLNDRAGSPVTIIGDGSPRLTPFSPVEVIDLEAPHGSKGFNADDFLTDEQFRKRFFDSLQEGGESPNLMQQHLRMRHQLTMSVDGRTYRRGKTVELHNGDFMRIVHILEHGHTQERFLQGFRLRRLSQCRRLFDQHLNELTMVIEEDNVNMQTNESGLLDIVPFSEVWRIRDAILTNAAFPSFGCREDPANAHGPRDSLRDQCRLVCRWKLKISIRPHSKGRPWVEKSILRLNAAEADVNFRLDDEHIRRQWRGTTAKMGSCAGWLQGERDFDLRERNLHQTLPLPVESDRLGHQTRRYTFGDLFCGAGGCSRGAKSAGLRVTWGFDFDPAAIDSYAKNFFGARCEATPADVFSSILDDNFFVDVLHFSPPCQPYSPAHTRPRQNDEMNEATFFAVGEIIKKSKPRVVTLENTFGLAQRWPEWMDALIRFFTALGFSVRWRVLNLAYYGVPQARRRLVVMASWLTTWSVLERGYPDSLKLPTARHIPRGFPNHDPDGATMRNLLPYNGDLPLKNCITTSGTLDRHPSGRRGFTVRELACLQSFPLAHKFGKFGVKKQFGNAVPPLFAKVLLSHIRRWLEEIDG
ncbi:MAG: hypothetical protein Q9176_001226 [Flavoplaca citrina]